MEVLVTEAGENVLLTAGEVHLQRCILDLTETYAKCEITVSEPIVPFRETIVPVPETDRVNEAIEGENRVVKVRGGGATEVEVSVTAETPNKQCRFRIRAVPLPADAVRLLDKHHNTIKAVATASSAGADAVDISNAAVESLSIVRDKLKELLADTDIRTAADNSSSATTNDDVWIDRVMSCGPRRCGPNILVNCCRDSAAEGLGGSVWQVASRRKANNNNNNTAVVDDSNDQQHQLGRRRQEHVSSVVNGFQLATLAGPVAEEPMRGVAFLLEEWAVEAEGEEGWGPLSGQIVSTVKVSQAFQLWGGLIEVITGLKHPTYICRYLFQSRYFKACLGRRSIYV